jgi:glycosyltransferase involved in cell wall biosynthesis
MMIHTLIIPTRNRQKYAKEAAEYYLKSERPDIELIIVDNSDNKELIYKELKNIRFDKRLKIIPSQKGILNMRENWERAIQHAMGEWITYIGDDDALDPNIVNLIEKIFKSNQFDSYECITWTHINYCWDGVYTDTRRPSAIIPVGENIIRGINSKETLNNILTWSKPSRSLGSGASIYHGAWKRSLLEKVTKLNNGKLFKYDTAVDYESGYNALWLTEKFMHLDRPFSILGACQDSNSASMLNSDIAEKKRQDHKNEGHENVYGFKEGERFPWSLSIVLSHFNQQWANGLDIKYTKNRSNFVKGLESEVHNIEPRYFEKYKEEIVRYMNNYGYTDLIKEFDPKPRMTHTVGWNGIIGNKIYIDPTEIARGILEFAPIAFSLVCPWQRVGESFKIEAYS